MIQCSCLGENLAVEGCTAKTMSQCSSLSTDFEPCWPATPDPEGEDVADVADTPAPYDIWGHWGWCDTSEIAADTSWRFTDLGDVGWGDFVIC